ncbi:MAG TPA: TraR/DksA C4-type zinc finger protein, partial [Acidimicrobiales bacterium]|nr:TraR/DksA C4-type zinc finger protein [Acidimicrobiales bacterium]
TKAPGGGKAAKAGGGRATKATKAVKGATKGTTSAMSTARGTEVSVIPPVDADGTEASDRFVETQRLELLAERDAYTRSANSLRAEAEELAQDREPGDVQFDEESGEGDSMNVERERDLALSAQAMASVEEIDRALSKIEQGTYGVCEKCGEPIPRERLKALPHAALCVRCKSGGLGRR